MSDWIRIVPLGGLGHIGGNMLVLETAEDLLVVDCGILFPGLVHPGVDLLVPKFDYVLERKHKLRGILLTHGHEDHLGALPFVTRHVDTKIFGTRLTLALAKRRVDEKAQDNLRFERIEDLQSFKVGGLTITPIPMSHSIPDAVAFLFETCAGRILHTGDFKIDPTPPDGRLTGLDAIANAGKKGIDLLLSDSTNATREGRTWSEQPIAEELIKQVAKAPQKVLLTAFSSNFYRLQAAIDACTQCNRKLAVVGRSMETNLEIGLEIGLLQDPAMAISSIDAVKRLPPERQMFLVSGSQGEPLSALTRVAYGEHGQLKVSPGDTVMYSSRRIPGNEAAVGEVVNLLLGKGVTLVDDRNARIHTSGHAFRDELREVLRKSQPRFFAPVHGELRHLMAHRELAEEEGIPRERIRILESGSRLRLERDHEEFRLEFEQSIEAGHLCVDGSVVGDVEPETLRQRRALSRAGIVFAVVERLESGKLACAPRVESLGVSASFPNGALGQSVMASWHARLLQVAPELGDDEYAESARILLRRALKEVFGRKPLVVVQVVRR